MKGQKIRNELVNHKFSVVLDITKCNQNVQIYPQ